MTLAIAIVIFYIPIYATPLTRHDLGTFGPTWSIAETSLLKVIQNKLQHLEQTNQLGSHQKSIQKHLIDKIKRPQAVEHVQPTKVPKTFYKDPSIKLHEDLKDHRGRLIHAKNTQINPLNYQSLSKPLLFIDGDDKTQLQWAFKHSASTIIFVKGSPLEQMKQTGRILYFDQGGTLTKQLNITQIPARVTQANDQLKVEELLL
jgi:conjugal transfer pilus assembly protein TraW